MTETQPLPRPTDMATLLAGALSQMKEFEFRAVVQQAVEEAIRDCDIRRVVQLAVEPVATEMIREILKDEAELAVLHAKVRGALTNMTVKICEPSRW